MGACISSSNSVSEAIENKTEQDSLVSSVSQEHKDSCNSNNELEIYEASRTLNMETAKYDILLSSRWYVGEIKQDEAQEYFVKVISPSWMNLDVPTNSKLKCDVDYGFLKLAPLHTHTLKHILFKTPFNVSRIKPQQALYWHSQQLSKPYLVVITNRIIHKYDINDQKWVRNPHPIPSWITLFSSCIDKQYDKLYIFCPWTFCVFDLNTEKWNFIHQHKCLRHDYDSKHKLPAIEA